MQGLPTLVMTLSKFAAETYGRDFLQASIAYASRTGGRSFWQAHVCVLSKEGLMFDACTPQEAFDSAMARVRLDTAENLAAVLGIPLTSAQRSNHP